MENTAVLFVHGIQGQPAQFRFLIDALPAGVEVCAPLLPGHGKTAEEFHGSRCCDWFAAVRRETEQLRAEGKRIIYVGHSMGCLLGLLVSRKLGSPYDGMLLLCCPFRPRVIGRIGDRIHKRKGEALRQLQASLEGNSVPVRNIRDCLLILRPYGDLFRLMSAARQIPPRAGEKLRFFFAGDDEVVSASSVRYARRWPSAEIRILEGCGHCYFPDEAKRILQKTLNELIEAKR